MYILQMMVGLYVFLTKSQIITTKSHLMFKQCQFSQIKTKIHKYINSHLKCIQGQNDTMVKMTLRSK